MEYDSALIKPTRISCHLVLCSGPSLPTSLSDTTRIMAGLTTTNLRPWERHPVAEVYGLSICFWNEREVLFFYKLMNWIQRCVWWEFIILLYVSNVLFFEKKRLMFFAVHLGYGLVFVKGLYYLDVLSRSFAMLLKRDPWKFWYSSWKKKNRNCV